MSNPEIGLQKAYTNQDFKAGKQQYEINQNKSFNEFFNEQI
jgi:hypothetical protein